MAAPGTTFGEGVGQAPPHFKFPDPFTGSMLEMDGAAPLAPPTAWFSQAAADAAPEKLQVFPGGRVAGVVAPAGRCLLNGSNECWMIPKPSSQAELGLAHTGFTPTAEGTKVRTGVIGSKRGHASEWASAQVAQEHYANTATQLMRGTYRWSDVAGGMTFVGAVWPDVTPRQIAEIDASPASIDYRWIADERDHRLVGACLVNIGGLPTRWRATKTASAVFVEPERQPAFIAQLGQSLGSMVALKIDAPQFVLPGGMPADQLHLTLAFFGDSARYTPEVQAAATTAVGQIVTEFGHPLLLTVSSVGLLGPPEETVVALLMQGDDLCGLRELLLAAAEAAGLECDDTYPVFTPHITLGPLDPTILDAALTLRGVMVSPPSVVMAFGPDNWTEVPLPRVGRPLEVETFIEAESPTSTPVAGSVGANEEGSMICETCQHAMTAAPPPAGPAPADQAQQPGGDVEARLAALEQEVAAIKDAMMQSQMAALEAMPVAIPA